MSKVIRFGVSIEEELLEGFDALIKKIDDKLAAWAAEG